MVAFPESFGGYYGPISGTGLHYHKWIDKNGFQVTGGILYRPDLVFGNILDYDLGGELQRRLYGDSFTNWLAGSLYLFAGGRHRGYIPTIVVTEGSISGRCVAPHAVRVLSRRVATNGQSRRLVRRSSRRRQSRERLAIVLFSRSRSTPPVAILGSPTSEL